MGDLGGGDSREPTAHGEALAPAGGCGADHLVVMVHGIVGRSALQTFRRRVAYSNAGYDYIVGWRTSSIRRDAQLPRWVDSTDMIYPHIVYEELSKAETFNQVAAIVDVDNCTIQERLLRGLKRVSWEKVDVSFHNSRVRYAAHSVIQVKDPVLHYEGADVIQHMIDHLIL